MTPDEFWQSFLAANSIDAGTRYFESFRFDVTERSANGLLELVLSGKKRATASSLLSFSGSRPPKVGDFSIVTDWAGEPRCIIKTTEVAVIPFDEVTFEVCRREGEDSSLESWRESHRRFFIEDGMASGYEFSDAMPVVFEDFEVVFAR